MFCLLAAIRSRGSLSLRTLSDPFTEDTAVPRLNLVVPSMIHEVILRVMMDTHMAAGWVAIVSLVWAVLVYSLPL